MYILWLLICNIFQKSNTNDCQVKVVSKTTYYLFGHNEGLLPNQKSKTYNLQKPYRSIEPVKYSS